MTRMNVAPLLDRAPRSLARTVRAGSVPARLLARVVNPLLPADETIVTVRSGAAAGLRIAIHPRHEKFYWTGAYERELQDALQRLLSPGMCVWDVGAHAGFMTLLAARLVGGGGHVHAFEPAAPNRARLARSLAASGADNVTVHPFAVAARSGRAVLHAHASSSMWTLVPELADGPGSEVDSRTLDDLVVELGTPDLIKIDIEGAESDALAGGSALLAHGRTTVLVEFSSPEALERARALCPARRFTRLAAAHWLLEAP